MKDFDIWWFYRKSHKAPYPYTALKSVDSELAKFDVHPDDVKKGYKGRRAHFMGRAIDIDIVKQCNEDPTKCIIEYLRAGRSKTARELAGMAVYR